ncbi:hypothetical protein VH1709_contig00047-0007 [Vibrio harveyi]|nr:hypothetical protein VH1709_contig00047-0007 [Vibrio harveyi]
MSDYSVIEAEVTDSFYTKGSALVQITQRFNHFDALCRSFLEFTKYGYFMQPTFLVFRQNKEHSRWTR